MCEPDFSAWSAKKNKKPNPDTNLRSAGGHLHIGLDEVNDENMFKALKAMDLFLGVPSVIMDTDTERKQLYGKAGAYRPKSYGFEYRTLSNFWIAKDTLIDWAYNNSHLAIDFANSNTITDDLGKLIQKCINTSNTKIAKELVTKFSIPVIEPAAIPVKTEKQLTV